MDVRDKRSAAVEGTLRGGGGGTQVVNDGRGWDENQGAVGGRVYWIGVKTRWLTVVEYIGYGKNQVAGVGEYIRLERKPGGWGWECILDWGENQGDGGWESILDWGENRVAGGGSVY